MPSNDAEAIPTPESIADYVKKNAPKAKMASMHHGPLETVREDDYQGHHIVIRTTYQIQVDDIPVMGHIQLTNDGQVGYHGLPNMTFDSAVDLVKSLIDHFPEDFRPGAASGHDEMPGMPGMSPMGGAGHKTAAPKRAPKSAPRKKAVAKPKTKASSTRKPK